MTQIRTQLVMWRMCACLSAVLVTGLLSGTARAAGAKRAGVPKFEGAQEALIRKQVMQVLKAHGYELAKSREMEMAVQNTGVLLESDDGFQKVAKELSLTVIVTGEVGKKRAKIIVHDGREGSVLGEGSFPGANPKKIAADVTKTFWNQLGADIARGHVPSGSKKPQKVAEAPEDDESAPEAEGAGSAPPPPPPEPKSKSKQKTEVAAAEGEPSASAEGEGESPPPKKKKKKKQPKVEKDAAEEEESGPGTIPPTLDMTVGPAFINRTLSYQQDQSGMRPYSLPVGAAAAVQIVWYPVGLFTDGPAQNLGIQIGIEQAFGIASSIGRGDAMFPMGATFGTTVHQFEGGVRYRIPFGAMGDQIWFSGGGGEHAFVFTGRQKYTSPLEIPDTIYRFLRAGIGARFELPSDFAVGIDAGYRLILNGAGTQFGQFFPHRTVAGFDVEAYVGYRVMENIEIRGGGAFRQYGYAMHSVAADTDPAAMAMGVKVAGGAYDRYLSFTIGASFMFGGSERPQVAEEEEAPPPKKKHKKARESDEDSGGGGEDASGGGDAE